MPRAIQAHERLRAQFQGEQVNHSEQQAATHTRLRGFSADIPGAKNDDYMLELAGRIAGGQLCNHAGASYTDYVHIGIGGSYLGPRLLCESLPATKAKLRVHFLANIDPQELLGLLPELDLQRTLWGVASKSFGTLETQANFAAVRSILSARQLPELDNALAITANKAKALEAGFNAAKIITLPGTVGGRFSLWSAMGLPLALQSGTEQFRDLLAGAQEMDAHAYTNQLSMPMLLALLDWYYLQVHGCSTQAILVYSHLLRSLPAYYQQLYMESLGKSVDVAGQSLKHPSGAVIFGGEGTNGQHAYHQLLMQGTRLIPCDFIVCARSPGASQFDTSSMHQQLLANAVAQAQALALGSGSQEPHKRVAGGQPSSIICLSELNARNLGALLALYEHRTALLGYLLNINPFDQWGVELGKKLAQDIYPLLQRAGQQEDSLIGWLCQQSQ